MFWKFTKTLAKKKLWYTLLGQKEQNNFSANLKKGDQVSTGAGMIGRITKIEDFVVELQIDSKSFVKVLKSSISKEATESLKDKNYLD